MHGKEEQPERSRFLTEGELFSVEAVVGKDFRDFGRKLKFDDASLDAIENDYRSSHGIKEMNHQLFIEWQERKGLDANVNEVIQALVDIGKSEDARRIFSSEKIPEPTYPIYVDPEHLRSLDVSKVLKKIKEYLKRKYLNLPLPSLMFTEKILPFEELFIDLVICIKNWEEDRNFQEKEEKIELNEIFDSVDELQMRRILIEGNPGFGKTTLVNKIIFDFAKSQPWLNNNFELVIPISLRSFEVDLETIICKSIPLEKISEVEKLAVLEQYQERFLCVLDGYDELPSKFKASLLPLLRGEKYPLMTVLLTSRPGQFSLCRPPLLPNNGCVSDETNLHGYFLFQKCVKIKGVSRENQVKFLQNYFGSEYADISKKLSSAPIKEIERLLDCPLFLLLIVNLLSVTTDISYIKSKTHLYKEAVNFQIKRSLVRASGKKENDIQVDIFSEANYNRYRNCCLCFGEIALNLLKKDCYFIKESELSCNVREFINLGFLVKNVFFSEFQEKEHYEIVHKTFLEFFAAFYLSSIDESSKRTHLSLQVETLMNDGVNGRNNEMMYTFLAGLCKPQGEFFKTLLPWKFMFRINCAPMIYMLKEGICYKLHVLHEFSPHLWSITSQINNDFRKSKAHRELLKSSSEFKLVDIIHWNLNITLFYPIYIDVKTLILNVTFPCNIHELFAGKIQCKHLICHFNIGQSVVYSDWKCITKKALSIIVCDTVSIHIKESGKNDSGLIRRVKQEIMSGIWKDKVVDSFSVHNLKSKVNVSCLLELIEKGKVSKGLGLGIDLKGSENVEISEIKNLIEKIRLKTTVDDIVLKIKNNTLYDKFQMKMLNGLYIEKWNFADVRCIPIKKLHLPPLFVKWFDVCQLRKFYNLLELKCDMTILKCIDCKLPDWQGYKTLQTLKLSLVNNTFGANELKLLNNYTSLQHLSIQLMDLRTDVQSQTAEHLVEFLESPTPLKCIEFQEMDEKKMEFFHHIVKGLQGRKQCCCFDSIKLWCTSDEENVMVKCLIILKQLLMMKLVKSFHLLHPRESQVQLCCKLFPIGDFDISRGVNELERFDILVHPCGWDAWQQDHNVTGYICEFVCIKKK